MAHSVFRIYKEKEYKKAGPTDLIELAPIPGGHPLFVLKNVLEAFVCAMVNAEFIHLSGPTGSAKSSLIETLYLSQENFQAVCKALAQISDSGLNSETA